MVERYTEARRTTSRLHRPLRRPQCRRRRRDDLYLSLPDAATLDDETREPDAKWPLQDYLDRVEREAIMEALEKTRYNKTAAAKLLGITFRALRYRLERLGIE